MMMAEPSDDEMARVLAERSPAKIESDELKPAGVLVPIFKKDGCWHLLLTRRTDTVDHHKGEISFPGGHMDPGDPDLACTALREAEEEVGIPRDKVKILGRLDDIFTVSSGFRIRPFVGRIPYPMDFDPAPEEIAEVIVLPLSEFLCEENFTQAEKSFQGATFSVCYFEVEGHTVWGATARILKQFIDLCMKFQESPSRH